MLYTLKTVNKRKIKPATKPVTHCSERQRKRTARFSAVLTDQHATVGVAGDSGTTVQNGNHPAFVEYGFISVQGRSPTKIEWLVECLS